MKKMIKRNIINKNISILIKSIDNQNIRKKKFNNFDDNKIKLFDYIIFKLRKINLSI